jgi:hypothetical protein
MQSKCTSEKWFDHRARSGIENLHSTVMTATKPGNRFGIRTGYVVDYIMFFGTYSESEVGSIVS